MPNFQQVGQSLAKEASWEAPIQEEEEETEDEREWQLPNVTDGRPRPRTSRVRKLHQCFTAPSSWRARSSTHVPREGAA